MCAAGHRAAALNAALQDSACPVTTKPTSRQEEDMSGSLLSRLDVVQHDMQRMVAVLELCLH